MEGRGPKQVGCCADYSGDLSSSRLETIVSQDVSGFLFRGCACAKVGGHKDKGSEE